ncbi:hypothetical protein DUZ99_11160 [Xylanibacillus composti]|uniref:Lipase/acylhydrolase n=1 Tax=Xylanibacillus composti TaxID=1572762 RepID=A0A8J4H2X9_9BACL|nr:GDSL-type esterase/lipase family protein [Xylanibacillus composti]MDT9725529.1 hypothetical protein [Xylanibacillus composti]GIQ67623.1 lipase/acylhydrolase [Xylanibacillus composti]
MRTSRWLWPLLAFSSLAAVVLLTSGLIYGVRTILFPGESNLQRAVIERDDRLNDDGIWTILGLGDSLTKGTGDASSMGYAGQVRKAIDARDDREVSLINMAVNGYTTGQLLEQIRQQNGVILSIQQADAIVMTIGGNDLYTPGEEVLPGQVLAAIPDALARMDEIFQILTELNPDARVLYVGLYHPLREIDPEGELSSLLHDWNYRVLQLTETYPQVVFVPTYDLFGANGRRYLSGDHYHPNEEGYKRIAARIVQVLEEDWHESP